MKPIWPILCALLCAVPAGAMPARADAGVAAVDGLRLGLNLVLGVAQQEDDRRHRRDERDDRRDDRRDGRDRDGGEQRDDRINRAIAIASSRGRVQDAGPMGGSLFWVRVTTDHGRVDFIVDTDSGRIVGQR
ncbi:MAG: hypothetical protein ACXU8U_00320 [Asticcacaulis sp.]